MFEVMEAPIVAALTVTDQKNTKIVATVGPACNKYEQLLELAKAGVNVFRLNFSHGKHEDHLRVVDHITSINEKYGLHLSILADLQGPKLRVGLMENDGIEVKTGQILTFVNEECVGNKDRIYMSYKDFAKDVQAGEKILLDDGKLTLEVVDTDSISTVISRDSSVRTVSTAPGRRSSERVNDPAGRPFFESHVVDLIGSRAEVSELHSRRPSLYRFSPTRPSMP